jgi:hypothetical protein
MATNFPTSLDSLTNPNSTDQLNSPSHSAQHTNANDAIEALQAKVGINGSAITTSHDYKISQLEAAITSGVSGTKLIYQEVRNQSGSNLAKGTAVRVTGSDGASGKLLIAAASNATESASSKTLGLISSAINNNSNGQVITEGLLENIDTTGAADGDPVWLGVNGARIYGLVNKPVAPAHLVYLGVVVRGGQQNTGSMYVSIQNGFEVQELHNVSLTNTQNKDALVYDSTTQLWKNYDLTQDFVSSTDVQNSLGDYIPLNTLGEPQGPAKLDVDGNLLIPENKIIIEGATANDYELTIEAPDVTSDITITLPNTSGTVALTSNIPSLTGYATETYVNTAVSNLVDSAPSALNTLNELSIALANDPNFATTVTNSLALKAPLASPTFTGTVTLPNNTVTNAMLAGSIANDKLANSSITINNFPISLGGAAAFGTDNIGEGTTNLYFTNERAQDAIGNSVGSGLSYNDTTGAISVDTAIIQARVADISDTEIGYLNGVTSGIQAQIDSKLSSTTASSTYAPINSPTLTGTPLAPTATAGTNTTQIATTQFVKTEISNSVQPGSLYQADAPTSPATGQIWVESDSNSDSFDPNIIRRHTFTATAGQTNFVASVTFIDGYEQVYFNGLLLLRTTDYTTSGSNTVILGTAAAAGDIVEIVTITNLNSVNTYTQAEIDSKIATEVNNLIASAPSALNTLDELAAALGDDANFASTVTTSLAGKKNEASSSISANTNLAVGTRYFATSSSALTLTLPANPSVNDQIDIFDASGNASTYNITVARNGKLINGNAGNFIIDVNGSWYTLVFTGNTYGWKVA